MHEDSTHMQAKTRISMDPTPVGLDACLSAHAAGLADRILAALHAGASEDAARLVTMLAIEARRLEIKSSLLEVAQGALSEATFWPAAFTAIARLFTAREVVLWTPQGDAWTPAHHTPEGRDVAVMVPAALLAEAITAGRVRTTPAPDAQGALRLCLLGPVRAEHGPVGVLQIVLETVAMRPEQAEDLAEALGHLELGLASVRRLEKLAYHASHDPLTGLANRRTFDGFIDREMKLAKRHGTPVSLLVIDVDHFKAYNDTHGHPAGDALLQALAGALTEAVRSTDFIARLGGEEFVVVLPHTDATGAHAAAEKVLTAIRALGSHPDVLGGRVTASVGVSTCDAEVCTADALLLSADQAMYRAKNSGRNRICQA
ncbi:Response regulator PleD [compost metagenome]